jgi:hypothetical protein
MIRTASAPLSVTGSFAPKLSSRLRPAASSIQPLGALVLLVLVVELAVIEVSSLLVSALLLASLRVELNVRQRESTLARLNDVGDEDATL